MEPETRKQSGRSALRFGVLFFAWLGAMAVLFAALRPWLATGYMWPLSWAAAGALEVLGVASRLGPVQQQAGTCELAVGDVAYLVTFECTGIFALVMCLAAVLAYPAPASEKVRGLFLVLPAFWLYSAGRLTVMGLVGRYLPAQIELFHAYLMVLVNVGFVLLLWLYWVSRLAGKEEPS
ncbi:MAG: hypothetical protein AB1505_19315 [Candidatus Latescibacterota bacterium]